ncbi:hypothetical protein HDK64DRAFT_330849 [Phyllosticta capitalensis]
MSPVVDGSNVLEGTRRYCQDSCGHPTPPMTRTEKLYGPRASFPPSAGSTAPTPLLPRSTFNPSPLLTTHHHPTVCNSSSYRITNDLPARLCAITLQTMPVTNLTTPDRLLAHARQELEDFPLSLLERYVGLNGLDLTEYALLVSVLISLTGSSPSQEQLFTAYTAFVTSTTQATNDGDVIPSIWSMPPVNPWYRYAVLTSTPDPPPQLVLQKDWDLAASARAVDLDVRALAHKIKRYMKDAPNVLQSVCRQEGLEVSAHGLEGYQERWIHGVQPTRPLEKMNLVDRVEIKPDLEVFDSRKETHKEVFVGRKRTLKETGLEEEGPEAAKARVQEHHDGNNSDEDKISLCSPVSAQSIATDKPDHAEASLQQSCTASQLLAAQIFGSDSDEAQTPDNNKVASPTGSYSIKSATPSLTSAHELTSLSPEEPVPGIEKSFTSVSLQPSIERSHMSASPPSSINTIDMTADSPSSVVAEPIHEWQNVDEGSRLSEPPNLTSFPTQGAHMLSDENRNDEVMNSHLHHSLEEFPYAAAPCHKTVESTQGEHVNDQPREPSENEPRISSAAVADMYSAEHNVGQGRRVSEATRPITPKMSEVIVLDSDSDEDEDQPQHVKSPRPEIQATLHMAESPNLDSTVLPQYDGPHDINHKPHELPRNEMGRFSGLPISPYCSRDNSTVYAGEVGVRACMCSKCRSQFRIN